MTKTFFLLALISMVPMPGCIGAHSKANVVSKRHARFGVESLSDRWRRSSFRQADLFFEHGDGDATIHLSSQCERFSDSPLEALTSQMLVGIGDYEIASQKFVPIAGRDALISEINSRLDGVNRYLKIMVLRKNRCVFDAVLSSRNLRQEHIDDFDKMIATFWAEAEL